MNIKLIERIDAKFNPIMIKEIYQGFRNRWFVIGYGLALLVCLGGYITIVLPASLQNETLGVELFKVLILSMMLVALLIIPTSAGNQLRDEITSNTLDLIAITNLSPWAIISGRFQAAGLKMLLLFACIGPFAMAAFLLGGIGITLVLSTLGFLLLFALCFCALFLMVNALPALNPRYKVLAAITQILLILSLVVSVDEALLIRFLYFTETGWHWSVILIAILYLVLFGLLFIFFFLSMAAELLTPPEIRTFFYAKLILAILLIVVCLPFYQDILFPTGGSLKNWWVFGLLFLTSLFMLYFFPIFWAGQVSKRAPHHFIAYYLFKEGYTPTLIYVYVLTFSLNFSIYMTHSDNKALWFGLFCVSYYTFFSGLTRLLRRFMKPEKRTVFAYLMLLLGLICLNGIVTLIYLKVTGGHPVDIQGSIPNAVITLLGAILVFLPAAYIQSWEFTREAVRFWMLLPLLIGLFAAWLGGWEETNE